MLHRAMVAPTQQQTALPNSPPYFQGMGWEKMCPGVLCVCVLSLCGIFWDKYYFSRLGKLICHNLPAMASSPISPQDSCSVMVTHQYRFPPPSFPPSPPPRFQQALGPTYGQQQLAPTGGGWTMRGWGPASDARGAVPADRHRPAPRRAALRPAGDREDDAGQGRRPPHHQPPFPGPRGGGGVPHCSSRQTVTGSQA